jgi:hypothetical protein
MATSPWLSSVLTTVCPHAFWDPYSNLITLNLLTGVEWQIVLTKCDLLDPASLAQSITAVHSDLKLLFPHLDVDAEVPAEASDKYSGMGCV